MAALSQRVPHAASVPQARGLRSADAVRVLAALAVVLFHYRVVRTPGDPAVAWLLSAPGLDGVVARGYLGVDVFFALSGFLLVRPWARHAFHGAPAPRVRDFYRRRALRIAPAYYAHLVFLFAVAMPLLLGVHYAAEHPALVAFNVAAHAAFLQYTTPLSAGSFGLNGALWTLTIEVQFYLLLPWIAARFVRRPGAAMVAALALTLAWRALAEHALGPLVAGLASLGAAWAVPESAVRTLVANQLPGYAAQFAVGMALGTWWSRRVEVPAGDGRPDALRLAALVSYAVYLWHLPLLLLWNRGRVLDGSALSLPAFLFVVGTVAWLSYALVERRFLPVGRAGPTPIIA